MRFSYFIKKINKLKLKYKIKIQNKQKINPIKKANNH